MSTHILTRTAPVVGALVATLASATTSAAATAPIEKPFQPTTATTAFTASLGDGRTAWTTQETAGGATPVVLWTRTDGAPRAVSTITDVTASGVDELEVGNSTDRTPVAILATRTQAGRHELRLVRLDTGAVRRISSTRRGQTIGGAALDHGRLYYALQGAPGRGAGRSSLWRAPLTGTSVGPATRLRSSSAGEQWRRVIADRGRIAVHAARPVDDGSGFSAEVRWRFGTPRGTWRRTVEAVQSDSGYERIDAAGFTRDRRALITVQEREDRGPLVSRLPLARGAARTTTLGDETRGVLRVPALDPRRGRILTRDLDRTEQRTVGLTSVVFR